MNEGATTSLTLAQGGKATPPIAEAGQAVPTGGEQGKTPPASETAANQKSLEMLFDYTKFHIGLYLQLGAAYIAVTNVS